MNAPRVTLEDIEANIVAEYYFTATDGVLGKGDLRDGCPEALDLLTICVLILRNGFTVLGQSACASPENFDEEIGNKIARENAIDKVWPLMGYELKTRLVQEA